MAAVEVAAPALDSSMDFKQRPMPINGTTERFKTFSQNPPQLPHHHSALNPLFPMAAPLNPDANGVRPQSSCNNYFPSSSGNSFPGNWSEETAAADYDGDEALYSSSTLPKPPLKGILKNTAAAATYPAAPNWEACSSASAELLFAEMDVLPFDNVPPCDDCVAKAKIKGCLISYLNIILHYSLPAYQFLTYYWHII